MRRSTRHVAPFPLDCFIDAGHPGPALLIPPHVPAARAGDQGNHQRAQIKERFATLVGGNQRRAGGGNGAHEQRTEIVVEGIDQRET
jgi:hypothetical protein